MEANIVKVVYHMGRKDGPSEKKYRKAIEKIRNSEVKVLV